MLCKVSGDLELCCRTFAEFCARKMLFGLCFFHASIQELHFAYLCILFVTFEYIAFATSSLGTSLYSTSFLIPSALAIPSVSFFPLCYIQGFLLISTTHVLNVCSWPFSAQHRRPELIVMSGTLHIWPSGLEHSVSPSCVYSFTLYENDVTVCPS